MVDLPVPNLVDDLWVAGSVIDKIVADLRVVGGDGTKQPVAPVDAALDRGGEVGAVGGELRGRLEDALRFPLLRLRFESERSLLERRLRLEIPVDAPDRLKRPAGADVAESHVQPAGPGQEDE